MVIRNKSLKDYFIEQIKYVEQKLEISEKAF